MRSWNNPYVLCWDPAQIDRVHASGDWDKADSWIAMRHGTAPLSTNLGKMEAIFKSSRQAFSYTQSSAFLSLAGTRFSARLKLLLDRWARTASGGTYFPVAGHLKCLMTDVLAEISFEKSDGRLATGKAHPVGHAMDHKLTSAMIWTLKLLSEHPDVQRKLRTELDLVLPHFDEGAPEAVGVDQQATPYLDAVVHEILRVEAVVPLTRRRAVRETTLLPSFDPDEDPVVVPAGTTVILLNAYAARAHLSDGYLFRPERWLDVTTGEFDQTRVWSKPFGGGARRCSGYQIALVLLRLFVAQLSLTCFVIPLPDELKADQPHKHFTRQPSSDHVGLKRWEDIDDEAGGMAEKS